jgi:hypothetical protein
MINETTLLPIASPSWLQEARQRLIGLGLPPEWPAETVEAPSERASKSADCALRLLAEHGLEPSWMLPSLEGGICIAFALDDRYADIELLNSGEISTTRSRGFNSVSEILPCGSSLWTAVQPIRAFLGEDCEVQLSA